MRRLVLVPLVLLAACGGGGDTTTSDLPAENVPAAPKASRDITVKETEFKLDPAQAAGGEEGLVTIKVVNDGKVAHSLAVEGPNGIVQLDGDVAAGDTGRLEVDLDKPGTYAWYCPLDGHRAKGMSGSITVGGSNPARGAEPSGTTTTATETTPTQTETQTSTQTQTQTQTQTETKTVTSPSPSPTATTGAPSDGY